MAAKKHSQDKNTYIVDKYQDIIAEELNVKKIGVLDPSIVVKKIYKPLWNKLSAKFGKDTWRVIQLGKDGNTRELPDGSLVIFDKEKNEWILDKEDYDIQYEWLSGDEMAADTGIIIKYDLDITPELAQEGVARELSRFLNQMRKDAGFSVEKKADCLYYTKDLILQSAITNWEEFLIQEALLHTINEHKDPQGDYSNTFTSDEWSIIFALKSH